LQSESKMDSKITVHQKKRKLQEVTSHQSYSNNNDREDDDESEQVRYGNKGRGNDEDDNHGRKDSDDGFDDDDGESDDNDNSDVEEDEDAEEEVVRNNGSNDIGKGNNKRSVLGISIFDKVTVTTSPELETHPALPCSSGLFFLKEKFNREGISVYLRDTITDDLLWSLESIRNENFSDFTFSPESNKVFASSSADGGSIKIWDLTTGSTCRINHLGWFQSEFQVSDVGTPMMKVIAAVLMLMT
jgi:hypothetical protein